MPIRQNSDSNLLMFKLINYVKELDEKVKNLEKENKEMKKVNKEITKK